MLYERIKSKIPSRHKGTPRQHSLKKILIMVRLLILSLFPCNKDSENLLQKNMLEICSNWVIPHFTKSLPQKKPIFFKGVGYHSPKLPPIFWLFCHASGTAPPSRHYVALVVACSRLLSARLGVKNPTYKAGLVGLCVESVFNNLLPLFLLSL